MVSAALARQRLGGRNRINGVPTGAPRSRQLNQPHSDRGSGEPLFELMLFPRGRLGATERAVSIPTKAPGRLPLNETIGLMAPRRSEPLGAQPSARKVPIDVESRRIPASTGKGRIVSCSKRFALPNKRANPARTRWQSVYNTTRRSCSESGNRSSLAQQEKFNDHGAEHANSQHRGFASRRRRLRLSTTPANCFLPRPPMSGYTIKWYSSMSPASITAAASFGPP